MDRYEQIRRLSSLMALELALEALYGVGVPILGVLFPFAPPVQAVLEHSRDYLRWTVTAARLLIWALMISTMTGMARRWPEMRRARLWYLLSILAFVLSSLYGGMDVSIVTELLQGGKGPWLELGGALVLGVVGQNLFSALGIRSILLTSAEMLEELGHGGLARRCRRSRNRLLFFAVAMPLLACSIVAAYFVTLVRGGMGVVLRAAVVVQFALAFGLSAWFYAAWLRAVFRVRGVWRAAEELVQ